MEIFYNGHVNDNEKEWVDGIKFEITNSSEDVWVNIGDKYTMVNKDDLKQFVKLFL